MVDDSEEASLRVFSKYAPKVPVVIVKTMKDKFLAVSREEVREDYIRKRITITDQEVLEKAEQKLLERSKDDSTELERKGFSTDDTPLAYVSRGMCYHHYLWHNITYLAQMIQNRSGIFYS